MRCRSKVAELLVSTVCVVDFWQWRHVRSCIAAVPASWQLGADLLPTNCSLATVVALLFRSRPGLVHPGCALRRPMESKALHPVEGRLL